MADRVEIFDVTIPAGTPIAAPLVTALPFSDGIVTKIIVTVPPGPSGFVGFKFTHMGGPVIPYTGTTFVVADDRIVEWDLTNMPSNSGWQLTAYNIDIFAHTLYLEILVNEIPTPEAPPVALLPIGQ